MTLVTRQAMTDDAGDFISGTEVDKAFVDQVYGQIDDQVHSTTNPTVKPKAITDEVVAARGSLGTLDARLDVSLNEDGTLKSQASLTSISDLQAVLGSRNVAVNGDLDDWSAGGASAPDNFTLTTLTIARTGPAMADTFTFGAGRFAAKLTRAGADGNLKQIVVAAADIADYANIKGQKFSVAVKGKTAIANHLRITVDDGVTTTSSSYHTGGGTEEHLTVTHTISGTATKLEVLVEVKNSAGDAYVGGLVFVFAPYAPSDWQALSAERDANATRRGLVSTGTQTIAGAKTLTGQATFSLPPLGIQLFARSTADFTKNNDTALANVTGLVFAVGANETWEFEFVMHGVSPAAADWKLSVTFPAAPTAVRYGLDNPSNIGASSANAGGASLLRESTGVEEMLIVRGLIRNGANAGNVQVQMAQNTLTVGDTIIRSDSFVVARRIA